MKVTPLERISLKDGFARFIRDAILSGKLEPGDRIVELKLAKDLGIGTSAVREALFELESSGSVTRITSKGTFVTRLTAEDVAQIFEVRQELEGLAVDLLQKRVTGADVGLLQEHADEMRAAALENDAQRFYRSGFSRRGRNDCCSQRAPLKVTADHSALEGVSERGWPQGDATLCRAS